MGVTVQQGISGLDPSSFHAFDMLGGKTGQGVLVYAMLQGSEGAFVAIERGEVVGYAAVIGDGAVFAFLTAIEVRRDMRGQGVGQALMAQILAVFGDRYALDLACDEDLVAYYERFGFVAGRAMLRRNYRALADLKFG